MNGGFISLKLISGIFRYPLLCFTRNFDVISITLA